MFVRRIRFKNLNSLKGEWDLDLTGPAITSDGIIAITGPTGAGKSTILDAISLALYGRTPRLGSINSAGNEIMSRHTGECFSEVILEVPSGVFLCHWSQRRAKKHPSGRLQEQRREIVDTLSGEVIATKIQDVADRVERITGMNFERFTRTMFLAQGDFAAFLMARPDERAPILEQITGTGVYSEISKRAHERFSEERKKLEILHGVWSEINTFDPDEEHILKQDLEQKYREASLVAVQLEDQRSAITWLKAIKSLQEELRDLEQQKASWQSRHTAFAPKQESLVRAGRALELAGPYSELLALRREQQSETEKQALNRSALCKCMDRLKKSKSAVALALTRHESAIVEFEKLAALLKKVRSIDLRLDEKKGPLEDSEQGLLQLKRSLDSIREQRNKLVADSDKYIKDIKNISDDLHASVSDENLVNDLGSLSTRVDFISSVQERYQAKIAIKEHAFEKKQQHSRIFAEKQAQLSTALKAVERNEQERVEVESALAAVLCGRTLEELKDRQVELNNKWSLLEKIGLEFKLLKKLREEFQNLQAQKEQYSARLAQVQILLPEKEMIVSQMLHRRDLLENQVFLLQKIGSYEQERKLLVEGDPCPLCGSREHPYTQADVNIEESAGGDELSVLKKELREMQDSLMQLSLQRLSLQKDSEHCEGLITTVEDRIGEVSSAYALTCAQLGFNTEVSDISQWIDGMRSATQADQESISRVIKQAESLLSRLGSIQDLKERNTSNYRKAETAFAEADYINKVSSEALIRAQADADESALELQSLTAELVQRLKPYGISESRLCDLNVVMEELIRRRESFISRVARKQELEQKLGTIQTILSQREAQIEREKEAVDRKQQAHALLQSDFESSRLERERLFGNRSPDKEERKASENVDIAYKELEGEKAALNLVLRESATLESRIRDVDMSLQSRQEVLNSREANFINRLKDKGFINEASYVASALPETERHELATEAQKLADELNDLSRRGKRKKHQLSLELEKKITDRPLSFIEEQVLGLQEKQTLLQQDIGALLRKQQESQNAKRAALELLQDIERQKKECSRWGLLHELIGSADGKKFRNFAQGLTFELLISQANRQLRKMNDRYILLHSPDLPLEFSVIDNYQAGEVRTAKNLSGGESFIISLALALGLSQLVSNNINVGSLFLDEGFGSLDEDSLDIALNSLAELRQNGRLIVIISHVQALKERIGTRIRVSPVSGGISRISGPGCKAIT